MSDDDWYVIVFKCQITETELIQEFEDWAFDNRENVIEISRFDDRYVSSIVYTAYKVKDRRLMSWMILKYNCFIKSTDYEDWMKMRKAIEESSNYTIDWKKSG